MKNKILIIVAILISMLVIVGVVYLIDQNRMENNKEVLFSTGEKNTHHHWDRIKIKIMEKLL